MSKYSSDSDSTTSRHSRHRRSSSSSSSSSRHHHRKSKKSTHSSKDKYKKSRSHRSHRKRSRSHSRSKSSDKYRYRSNSRDRHYHRSHRKSRSHSRSHSSRHYSRSSSRGRYSRKSKSPHRRSLSSESRSRGLSEKNRPIENPTDQLREKLLKAIKAVESADHQLKAQGVLPKGVKSRNDIDNLTTQTLSKAHVEAVKDINSHVFIQKTFVSSKTKPNIKVDGDDSDIVILPSPPHETQSSVPIADPKSIFHCSFFVDPQVKLDKWVKKLYQIRQKAVSGEPMEC